MALAKSTSSDECKFPKSPVVSKVILIPKLGTPTDFQSSGEVTQSVSDFREVTLVICRRAAFLPNFDTLPFTCLRHHSIDNSLNYIMSKRVRAHKARHRGSPSTARSRSRSPLARARRSVTPSIQSVTPSLRSTTPSTRSATSTRRASAASTVSAFENVPKPPKYNRLLHVDDLLSVITPEPSSVKITNPSSTYCFPRGKGFHKKYGLLSAIKIILSATVVTGGYNQSNLVENVA